MLGLMFFGAIALLVWIFVALTPKREGRSRLKPALIIVGIILGYLLFNPLGYVDTQLACRKDGGLRGQLSQKSDGFFFDQGPGYPECKICQTFVIDKKVPYVEYEVYGAPPKYFRASMGRFGDPKCSHAREVMGSRIRDGECLVISNLSQKPTEGLFYKAQFADHVNGRLGSLMLRQSHAMGDLKSQRVLVSYRTYRYASPANRMLDVWEPLYECPSTGLDYSSFLARVLKRSNHDFKE